MQQRETCRIGVDPAAAVQQKVMQLSKRDIAHHATALLICFRQNDRAVFLQPSATAWVVCLLVTSQHMACSLAPCVISAIEIWQSSAVWWQALLRIGLLSAATAASTHAIAVNLSNHSDCVQLAQVSRTVLLNQDSSSTCLQMLVILQQHWTVTYDRHSDQHPKQQTCCI